MLLELIEDRFGYGLDFPRLPFADILGFNLFEVDLCLTVGMVFLREDVLIVFAEEMDDA